ncbi:hypothetical protein PJL18_04166 [Paenarthrobacter nicotinovorans]|nr:hypothetical protein [Paenarthrobacter nicotinovorans]
MNSYRGLTQLLRELGQVLVHDFVPRNTQSRSGLVERLLDPGCCVLYDVVDLRREVRQPILDPRRYNCHAVGKVVRGGLQPLLDPGGSGVNAVLDARNSPIDGCFHTGRSPVACVIHTNRNGLFEFAGNTVCFLHNYLPIHVLVCC